MTMRAEFFRQKAKECVALAKTMTDQLSRLELERTAAHWLRLADNADLLERLEEERRERQDSSRRQQECENSSAARHSLTGGFIERRHRLGMGDCRRRSSR